MHFRNLEDQHQTIHQNYEDFGHPWITLCSDHICWLDIVSLIHPRNFYPSRKSKLKLRLYVRSEDRIKIMYISKIVKPIFFYFFLVSKANRILNAKIYQIRKRRSNIRVTLIWVSRSSQFHNAQWNFQILY